MRSTGLYLYRVIKINDDLSCIYASVTAMANTGNALKRVEDWQTKWCKGCPCACFATTVSMMEISFICKFEFKYPKALPNININN